MATQPAAKTAPGFSQWVPGSVGWVGRFRADPLAFLCDARRRFGDVVRLRFGPIVFHLVAHPDHVRHVLLDHQKNYPRSGFYKVAALAAGEGLVTTDGAVWRRLRRMAQPAFHPQRIAALAAPMTEATAAMLERWREHAGAGTPFDVSSEFMKLALRIAGRAFLGVDLAAEAGRFTPAVSEALTYLEYRFNHVLSVPAAVPTPRNLRFRRALRDIDSVIMAAVERRRGRPDLDAGDLLSMLLAVREEETGAGLTDRELRDQFRTFVVAGYETTAVALAWTVYLLSQHPDAAERVREEVARVVGGRTPDAGDLPGLAFTRRALEESLRLYPPVYALIRDAVADDEIDGYRIRAGSTVLLSPYVTHHHPDVWPGPERFDPDRFLPGRSAGRPRFAWFPFIGGPHQCIGQEFAMTEMTLVVAMIARSFRLALAPGTRVVPRPLITLRPRDGLHMTVKAL